MAATAPPAQFDIGITNQTIRDSFSRMGAAAAILTCMTTLIKAGYAVGVGEAECEAVITTVADFEALFNELAPKPHEGIMGGMQGQQEGAHAV